ncbi:extracellular solute-binding protein [Bifidobacterium sp. ESL0769]|uniref:ABC transporter substrate-binding protein n=1 Tax=Bifidobacterium sp. ESL0769 TaxID=2983229 RepID=UPI0023F9E66F|nr:extracellular solute-binding protein [Bifidobacterium sp. ESL0769]WEV67039.1 extracellular solute-binding protein [Bifidobacterium sp. ESL0769]
MRSGKVVKALSIVASVAMLAGMSACGGNAKSSSDSNTITWLSARPASEGTIKSINAIAKEYAKKHPGFKLQFQNISDRNSYNQKLKVLASSNQLPDMWDADPDPYFKQLVSNGKTEDIGALYKELGVQNKFYKISTDYPKLDDGSLHLITLSANAEYFFYNKDAFKAANITEAPTTFDEFLQDLPKLKQAGYTPLAVDGKDQWPFYRYLGMLPFRETGNTYLDQLKDGKVSMGNPTGKEAIEFLKNVSQYFQEGFTNTDATASLNLFKSKKAAMTYDGTWDLPELVGPDGNLKSDIGYFRMPILSSKDKTKPTDFFANSGIGTAISKGKLTPTLKDFLKYFFKNYGDVAFNKYATIPSVKPDTESGAPQVYRDILKDIAGVNTYAKVWDVQLDSNTTSVLGRQCQSLLVNQGNEATFISSVDQAIKQNKESK